MKVNKDMVTTVLGGLMAAATAVEPVLNASQGGALQREDYLKLVVAVMMAVFGWFTNRKATGTVGQDFIEPK